MLRVDESTVRERVKNDPQLYALYGKRSVRDDEPKPPTEATTMLRSPDDLAPTIKGADLGMMVQETERILLEGGLEKLGVRAATIKKLKSLRDLNVDAGAMLARSLQDTHQLYYLRLLNLDARIDEIYETYLNPESPTYDAEIDPMTRMFWQRAYNECVEQMGKGHDRMMAGTQAMVAMMDRGKDDGAKKDQAKPAWEMQVPKTVARKAAKAK